MIIETIDDCVNALADILDEDMYEPISDIGVEAIEFAIKTLKNIDKEKAHGHRTTEEE